ncbi:hypothetical protein NEOLEDRAFT_1121035 [Neolentinus lepideus HHB14362 ss-1]|uniref:Zn(2)-C6 fungal-type domain-containing protein n=1 Tax=Neolentinus lepideus HHB14362 ss-1 TaxID=1314782 RepID=A0A165PWL9_9AGAM|nr:hypothetical protein NEOLEDRAFT_1121035 [Neolentinus lepideus HHB14362 ss-1]
MIPEGISESAGVSSWTRRTSKACANCRRDKIKCDGARPCSSCIKKRFPCIDGCEHCRKARIRCEEGRPCKQCREKDLECKDEAEPPPKPTIAVDLASAVAYPPGPSAPNSDVPQDGRFRTIERAKLACLSCRRDNKKCDDDRPCRRCVARGQDCIHVEKGPKQVKARCNGCRQDSRKCEDVRPCKNCVYKGIECTDTPRKGRGHGIRTKAVCNRCRRDKVRCDGGRPCSTCERKGIQCVAQPCRLCVQEGRSARACTHTTPSEPAHPSVSYENSSSSLQVPQAAASTSSFPPMDSPQYLHHDFPGVQRTPEAHVSHYPAEGAYGHISSITHYSLPMHADPSLMGPAQTYSSLSPDSHSVMSYPLVQTQSTQYSDFSMMESNYGSHDLSGRMVSAERYV